jgi:hypothetical protein
LRVDCTVLIHDSPDARTLSKLKLIFRLKLTLRLELYVEGVVWRDVAWRDVPCRNRIGVL